jgi:hypothetical protein
MLNDPTETTAIVATACSLLGGAVWVRLSVDGSPRLRKSRGGRVIQVGSLVAVSAVFALLLALLR